MTVLIIYDESIGYTKCLSEIFFFNYLCVFNLSLNQGQYNQEQTQSNKMAYSITGSTESRLASNPGSVHVCSHVRLFWDPINCSPPDSSVHGVFQARLLEWVTISYSRGSSWPRERNSVFCVSWNGRWILYQSTFWDTYAQYTAWYFRKDQTVAKG